MPQGWINARSESAQAAPSRVERGLSDLTAANAATAYLAGESGLIPLVLYMIAAVVLTAWAGRQKRLAGRQK